ncbi:MAG: AtpZ/AtpI family protein [Pseudomonadota bacterium]|nr:AtpZ/AtpI family protein [Pseudomonadota bacterium]
MASDGDDDEALKARLSRLAGELKSARPKPPASAPLSPSDRSAASAWSLGMKAGSEFVAAVVVGGAIGWGLDWLLHTKPGFTILFFLLGVAAGTWNVIRATSPKGGA